MTSNLCAHYANESCLSLSTQQYQNLLPLLHVWHDWKHSLSYIRHHPNSQPLRHSILFLPRRQHQGWRFCFIYLISHVQWGGILVPWNTALLVITCNNIKFFFFHLWWMKLKILRRIPWAEHPGWECWATHSSSHSGWWNVPAQISSREK